PSVLAARHAHGGNDGRAESSSLPGSLPANSRPPGEPMVEGPTGSTMSLASTDSRAAPAPRSSNQVASAGSGGLFGGLFSSGGDRGKSSGDAQSGGVLDRMSRLVGLRGS